MSCLPVFPNTGAIPPASFYNIKGLAGWLNQNSSYKPYFAGYFPYLLKPSEITSSLSTSGYNPERVPLFSNVTTLSQYQAMQYNQELMLFQKVYGHNSNAYVNYVCNGVSPVYYTFRTYQEQTQYKAAVSLVNKLYPFKTMAEASSINWQIPFPVYM